MKLQTLIVLIAAVAVASCTTAPPPTLAPEGEERYLIDPRTGWNRAATLAVERRFENAWRDILAGDFVNARRRLDEVRDRDATYAPANLAEAAIEIREGRLDAARAIVDRVASRNPGYSAAEVYEAEIDVAQNRLRSAYERYRTLLDRPNAPLTVPTRYAELQTRLFDQLYSAAINAPPADAIRLLYEALLVNPAASAARLLVVQKLIALREFDEAKRELDPLLSTSAVDQPEVQEALAEIDVGNSRFEEAIARYERLARRDTTGRYARRLEEVKEQFAAANMPPQVLQAMEAESINRAELAVLMYWKVASIRFAQNVPTPPIATDIGEMPGRDEIIRAIALGIYPVDPLTRRVYPDTLVTGSALARAAARVLTLRGASCARQVPSDTILSACGVSVAADDLPVSGRSAAALLEQVDRAISR